MVFKNVTGATAPTARMQNVDRCAQVLLSRAAATTPTTADTPTHSDMVRMLTNTLVDIMGMKKENRGRSCELHECCGDQVQVMTKVKIVKERMIYRDGGEEDDVLAVYLVGDGVIGCKVGFLAPHLALRGADDYDGLYVRVIEVYSNE
jgi:hypothetical protein